MLGGWLLAGLVGLPLGIAMAWWRRLRWIVFPVFQLVRPVPPLAWIPLAIIWLGIGDSARISVVFIAALVPWVMNSMQAVYSVDAPARARRATLGASDPQILTRVVCRTALPTLVAGARIALGNAWTTLIAAELLAASAGLGYVALNASRTLETGILLVAMGIIGLLGALFSVGMQPRDARLAPWSAQGRIAMDVPRPRTRRRHRGCARAGACGAGASLALLFALWIVATAIPGLVRAARAAVAVRRRRRFAALVAEPFSGATLLGHAARVAAALGHRRSRARSRRPSARHRCSPGCRRCASR